MFKVIDEKIYSQADLNEAVTKAINEMTIVNVQLNKAIDRMAENLAYAMNSVSELTGSNRHVTGTDIRNSYMAEAE